MYWLPHATAETDGLKQGEGQHINLAFPRVTVPCDLWSLAFASVQTVGAYWLGAVHPFGIYLYSVLA